MILQWAETENKCPCCKSRFNRIDRVKKLPPASPPTTTTSRRGKRKRSDNTNNSGSNTRRRTGDNESTGGAASSSAAAPRVNSRTVEDRNQQHLPAGLSIAMLESIFNSAFMGPGGFGLSTGERGRTTIRFPVPASMAGEDGDLDDMAGMLRMILEDATIGGPSARFTVQVRRTNGPPAAGEAGQASSGAAAASSRSSSGSSPRRGRSSPRAASSSGESRASRQRSSLFSYFSRSPSSRRSRSSASGAARSSSASRPASRSDSGVIDLANSDTEDMP